MKRAPFLLSALLLAACGSDDVKLPPGAAPGTGEGGVTPGGDGGWDPGPGGQPGQSGSPGGGVGGSVGGGGDPGTPVLIDTCKAGAPGAPDAATVSKLMAGGQGATRLLYPYDGTVFPRGLLPPTIMWDGASKATAVYVHITGPKFEYKGCATQTADNRFQLPKEVWDAAGQKTRGKQQPYSVELTVLSDGKAIGPIKSSWIVAQATIKGSIYYNSYSSLKGIPGIGKVLRIAPGKEAEPYIATECNGCHSVSANGSRLTSQTLATGGRAYNIAGGTPKDLPPIRNRSPYVALTPDGSRYVLPSLKTEVARQVISVGLIAGGDPAAALINTDTGAVIPSPGLPTGALMPSFSPDGKLLVFNDADKGSDALASANFDLSSNTFSNYQVIFQDSAPTRPGWPFALPDNKAVVFVRADGLSDWSGNGAGLGGSVTAFLGLYSELFMVDLDTKQPVILARAMGYATPADAAAKKSNLPFGNEDIGRAYFPTVSPVAAGGYFWVFFDAMRHYGNMGQQRQLWGTAIEISPNGDYSVDRSSPSFYLPGQEFGTGNHRAFTALDACKMDGDACTSGVDCCGGFCTKPEGSEFSVPGTCSSKAACAQSDERCQTSADCCPVNGQPLNSCIGNVCTQLILN